MPARWMDYVPLDDLQRAPRNPKNHASDLIAKSLSRHGYVEPITLDERTGRLVAGHGRLDDLETRRAKGEAAPDGVEVRDGAWLVPVARGWSSKDDAQAAAYLVTSNQTTIAGGWDVPELVDVLSGLAEVNVDELIGTGFGTADIDDLIASLQPKADPVALNDPDAVPEPPVAVQTKRGDMWLLGENRLLCGDATEATDVGLLMAGRKAGLLWTDPPYGVSYAAKNRFLNRVAPAHRIQEPILGDHGDPAEMATFWRSAFGVVRQHMAPGASYYVTGPQGGDLLLLLSLRDSGFPLRHMLIWAKNNLVLGRSDYHYKHEPIIFGWVEGAAHSWFGGHGATSLWEIDKPHSSRLHPTMKPVELIARALRNSLPKGGLVVDPFAGSGSTLIAAHQEGRVAYLMELSEVYCDVICRRFQEHVGVVPILEARGEPHDFTVAAPAEPVSP